MSSIKLTGKQLKMLKESISLDGKYKFPKYVYDSIKNDNTSLEDSPAFPISDDFKYSYKLLKTRYKELIDKLEELSLPTDSVDAENELGHLMTEAIKKEKPIRFHLNKLCENILHEMFAIPSETVNLTCELVDKVKPTNPIRIMPEDDGGSDYQYEDVLDIEETSNTVKKRRFIDALIQGGSIKMSRNYDMFSDWFIEHGFEELLDLYEKIDTLNDYLIFINKEHIDKKSPKLTSYVGVHLGHKNNKTRIKSQGLIFIHLLKETIRGFLELFSSHGLPEDNHKAQLIIRRADFTMAEPWDIRFGVTLWDKMFKTVSDEDTTLIPYIFSEYCKLETNEFFNLSKELLANTKKGNEYISDEKSRVKHDNEYQTFLNTIQQKNVDTSLINDGYMSEEDLDNFTLSENQENEYIDNKTKELKDYFKFDSDKDRYKEILSQFKNEISDIIESISFRATVSNWMDAHRREWREIYMLSYNGYFNDVLERVMKYPELCKEIIWYLKQDNRDNANLQMKYKEDSINDITKNDGEFKWLIHFSPVAKDIFKYGFIQGTKDFKDLAFTKFAYNKKPDGYNFAFEADSVGENEAKYYCGNNDYHKCAVMFQANGIKVFHNDDKQNQVIFYGPNAKNFVLLEYKVIDEDNVEWGWAAVDGKGKDIVSFTDIEQLISWVKDNYWQYKKVLSKGTEAKNDYYKPNSIHENRLYEYMDRNVSDLKRYFNMDDESKDAEFLYNHQWDLFPSIEKLSETNDTVAEWRENYPDDYEEMSDNAECEPEGNIAILKAFPDIYPIVLNYMKRVYTSEGKDSLEVFDYEGDVRATEWLIHFSDDAEEMFNGGFTLGTKDMNQLALTYKQNKGGEGYNFAFLADDANNYDSEYGKYAVMFKASGIKAWHNGDQEHQVMFYGPSARDFVLIRKSEYSNIWYIGDVNHPYYESENIEDVIKWVKTNYNQYKRVIGNEKLGKKYSENEYNKNAKYSNYNSNKKVANNIHDIDDEEIQSLLKGFDDVLNGNYSESKNTWGNLLTENKESKNLKKARNFLVQNYNLTPEQAMNGTIDVRNLVPNSRLADCKFVLGVVRMYMNNELRDGGVKQRLDSSLKYAASDAHVNEYDNNLNGLSAMEIIRQFASDTTNDLENDKQTLASKQYNSTNNNGYTIVPIDSFEEAEKYGEYTSWCVTHHQNMYDSYTSDGVGRFYFCLKNGFEDVEAIVGNNCPLDEYGLSMIAVSVNSDGSCNTITCRWNHDNRGNDHIMTTEQLSDIIGQNFYDVFKPRNVKDIIDDILSDGNTKYEFFSEEYEDTIYVVEGSNNNKCVFIDSLGRPVDNCIFSDVLKVTGTKNTFVGKVSDKYVLIDSNLNNSSKFDEIDGNAVSIKGQPCVLVADYNIPYRQEQYGDDSVSTGQNYLNTITFELIFEKWHQEIYYDENTNLIFLTDFDNTKKTFMANAKTGVIFPEKGLDTDGYYTDPMEYNGAMVVGLNQFGENKVSFHDINTGKEIDTPNAFKNATYIKTLNGKNGVGIVNINGKFAFFKDFKIVTPFFDKADSSPINRSLNLFKCSIGRNNENLFDTVNCKLLFKEGTISNISNTPYCSRYHITIGMTNGLKFILNVKDMSLIYSGNFDKVVMGGELIYSTYNTKNCGGVVYNSTEGKFVQFPWKILSCEAPQTRRGLIKKSDISVTIDGLKNYDDEGYFRSYYIDENGNVADAYSNEIVLKNTKQQSAYYYDAK